MANPGPIAELLVHPSYKIFYKLDGIVTVVDALNIVKHLGKSDEHEAEEQIAFADCILINKVDLVSVDEKMKLVKSIKSINPRANLVETDHCNVNLSCIMNIRNDKIEMHDKHHDHHEHEHEHHHHHEHKHTSGVTSVAIKMNGTLDLKLFNLWIAQYLTSHDESIFRSKGTLHVAGVNRVVVFHGVHSTIESSFGELWTKPEEEREIALVFIGKNLSGEEIKSSVEKCLIPSKKRKCEQSEEEPAAKKCKLAHDEQ